MFDFCAWNRNRFLGSLKTPKRRVPHWRKPVQRPALEILEDRTMLSTWYVNCLATGGNNGQNWANAYTDLQAALTSTQLLSGDQIWVAQGTYRPTSGTDQTISFALKDGVQVYGGFAGTETNLTQRDWVHNVTTLSGDIGKPGDNSDNSYHVVTTTNLTSAAVLDGFTITAGNANGSLVVQENGGGMYNSSSSPTLTNLTFSSNSAINVCGGMFNSSSSPTLTNVIFSNNSATYAGGGMYNYASSSPTLTNVTFSNNSANFGGGMENYASSSPTLTNCILWGDKAFGPAIAEIDNESSGSVTVSYSDVQGGWAGTGNINADPRFVDPAHGDLHLQAGSPAIDAGTNTFSLPGTTNNLVPSFDLDNNPRPVDGDGDGGATTDMGAYEFLPAPALPGLTDWYRAEGNADDGVGGNPGTLVGGVSFAPGKAGQAFSFNGSSYVSVPDAPSLSFTGAVTLDAWVNPATLNFSGGFGAVVAKSNYLGCPELRAVGDLRRQHAVCPTSTAAASTSTFNTAPGLVSPGVWTNVAGVIDTVQGVMQVYVNGQLVASQATSGPMVADTAPLTIGADRRGDVFLQRPDRRGPGLQPRPCPRRRPDTRRHDRCRARPGEPRPRPGQRLRHLTHRRPHERHHPDLRRDGQRARLDRAGRRRHGGQDPARRRRRSSSPSP